MPPRQATDDSAKPGSLVTVSEPMRWGISGYSAATYGDAFADIYDEWYESLDDDDFIELVSSHVASTSRVLELGVGTGRLMAALARRCAPSAFVGIDSSEQMLTRARQRPECATAELMCGDFSQTLPDGVFDVVFCGYNTLFNLPDDDALSSCLSLVRSHLAPSGRFLVDVITPPSSAGGDHIEVRSMTTDETVLSISRHDPDQRRMTGQFVQFSETHGVRVRPWSVHYVSPAHLDELAHNAGLVLESRMDAGEGSPRHLSVFVPRM